MDETSKKGKASRRRSTLGTTSEQTPIVEEPKDDELRCQLCGQMEKDYKEEARWIECSYCREWMHIGCIEQTLGITDSVPPALWQLIEAADEWDFRCPGAACGSTQSVPLQLLIQHRFTRRQLVNCGISEDLLQTGTGFDLFGDSDSSREGENPEVLSDEDTAVKVVDTGATSKPMPTVPTVSKSETELPGTSGIRGVLLGSEPSYPPYSAPTITSMAGMWGQAPVSTSQIGFNPIVPTGFSPNPYLPPQIPNPLPNMPRGQVATGIAQPMGWPQGGPPVQAAGMDMSAMFQFMQWQQMQMQTQQQQQQQQMQAQQQHTDSRMEKMFQLIIDRDERDRREKVEKDRADREEREKDREERAKDRELQRQMCASSVGMPSRGEASAPQAMNLKLPKLKLPTFSGDILKWPEFWDLFENMIHKNSQMSKREKLEYLKMSLSGQPAALVASFTVTDDNYDAVIATLQKRYDDTDLIVRQLYSKLQNYPISGTKGTELRKAYDDIFSICTQLSNMGEDVESPRLLLQLIQQKFPNQVQLKLEDRKEPDVPWTFRSYKTYLDRYITTLEKTYGMRDFQPQQPTGSSGKSQLPPKGKGKATEYPSSIGSSAAGLLAGKQEKSQSRDGKQKPKVPTSSGQKEWKQKYPCAFCESMEHLSQYCPTITDMNDRQRIMFESKRCFLCLGTGHRKKDCQNPRKTKPCEGCGKTGWHHPALCQDWLTSLVAGMPSQKVEGQRGTATIPTTTGAISGSNISTLSPNVDDISYIASGPRSILQTAIADVLKPKDRTPVPVRVLLDTGSSTTWVSRKLADKLGLTNLRPRWITVGSFSATNPKRICGYDATLEIATGDNNRKLCTVMVIDHLTIPITRYQIPEQDRQFLQENPQYQIARGAVPDTADQCSTFDVEILFGQDYIWELLNSDMPQVELPSGLKLLPSVFGYLIGGKYGEPTQPSGDHISYLISTQFNETLSEVTMLTQTDLSPDPKPNLADFWDLETIGIRDSPVVNDDDEALDMFNRTIQFEDGRYQVVWSWKSEDIELPENRGLAFGRFKTLAKRLTNDAELRQKYDDGIQDQLKKGVIELVDRDAPTGPRVHYLPHHPVITPLKSTTKLRIVYNASSKERKDLNSLNDCLYRGPVILPDLSGMLLRFRMDPIAILADVEKAFLQVGLQPPERDVTRFFWYKDASNPKWEDNVQIYRFTRVAFGIICSPFLLEATIKYHLNKIGTPIALKVMDNIYVDNVLMGAKTVDECRAIYTELKENFRGAHMNLREWTSNSTEFIGTLPETDQVNATKAKILGLCWHLSEDEIQITGFSGENRVAEVTKRHVLHTVAKIFDPLGFFNPVCFHGKIFLHRLWLLGKKWDEHLEEKLIVDWRTIEEILSQISDARISRYLTQAGEGACELLIFSDASQQVYGTAVYLRRPISEGFQTDLIFSKSRIATRVKNGKTGEKQPITLPRLELLAVLIGVRAANFVMKELKVPIMRRVLWTDSQCVLHWIQSVKPLPVFIENRLKEIRKTTDITYRYIPSEENPADYLTRGKTVAELDSLWWHGPLWLENKVWPEPAVPELTPEALAEIRSQDKPEAEISLFVGEDSAAAGEILKMLAVEKFSSFQKLLNVTVYVLRAVHNFKKGTDKKKGPLTATELEEAERFLVKTVQKEAFSQIFYDIKSRRKNSLQQQLGLQIGSDGLLRCYGRLQNADLPFEAKCQILLPGNGQLTRLIVEEMHRRTFHYQTAHTLAKIRMKYWIPKGRRVVSQILKQCLICKAVHGGPYKLRPIPVLPKERVNQAQPFQYVGVDYLGPIYVKSESNGQSDKTWICLFTCLVSRAVHLELAKDMSTEQFLNCFRRLIARRGRPNKVISDNAPNFKLASTVLEKAWHRACADPEAIEYFTRERINWVFITEFAPWQGGFYERLVGVVKNALRKSLGKKLFRFEELMTLLTEVEAVVNTRPLTYVSSDTDSTIITPADFLAGNLKVGMPEVSTDDYIPKLDSTEQVMRYLGEKQIRLNKFWHYWSGDYLQSLHERFRKNHKHPKVSESREPVVGEVVLIKEENVPRGRWKRGRIVTLNRRKDGEITQAVVRSPNGNLKSRPINLLFPLEIRSVSEDPHLVETSVRASPTDSEILERKQPDRRAKVVAREKIYEQMKSEEDCYLMMELFLLAGVS